MQKKKLDLSKFFGHGDADQFSSPAQFSHVNRNTVAINELLSLKNAGAQISMFFTSNE